MLKETGSAVVPTSSSSLSATEIESGVTVTALRRSHWSVTYIDGSEGFITKIFLLLTWVQGRISLTLSNKKTSVEICNSSAWASDLDQHLASALTNGSYDFSAARSSSKQSLVAGTMPLPDERISNSFAVVKSALQSEDRPSLVAETVSI